jgi:hypothetical protein
MQELSRKTIENGAYPVRASEMMELVGIELSTAIEMRALTVGECRRREGVEKNGEKYNRDWRRLRERQKM